jgi:hypothetical protein
MTDFRALCKELHAAFNTYAVDMAHHDLLERARAALAESVLSAERERSRISIDEMCEILRSLEIKGTEYTDCTILYEVTFDQLRAICDARAALAEQPVVPMDKLDRLIALDQDDPTNALPLPTND